MIRNGIHGKWGVFESAGFEVQDICLQPDGEILGVGKNDNGVHVLNEEGNWGELLTGGQCLKSVDCPGDIRKF